MGLGLPFNLYVFFMYIKSKSLQVIDLQRFHLVVLRRGRDGFSKTHSFKLYIINLLHPSNQLVLSEICLIFIVGFGPLKAQSYPPMSLFFYPFPPVRLSELLTPVAQLQHLHLIVYAQLH